MEYLRLHISKSLMTTNTSDERETEKVSKQAREHF